MFQLNFNFFDFHRDFSLDDDDVVDDASGGMFLRIEREREYMVGNILTESDCFRYVMPYVIYLCVHNAERKKMNKKMECN
jgi:hypothetical protein